MADEIYGFGESEAARIARSVRKSEQTGPQLPVRRKNGQSDPSASFWVQLGEETTASGGGIYKWDKVELANKDFSTTGETATSGDDFTAIEANRGRGLTGRYAEVSFRGYDDDGLPRYVFNQTLPGLVLVNVVQDGGADGDGSSPATWTYTVTTLGGAALGTAIPQTKPRPNGSMVTYAGPGGGIGVAQLGPGDPILWDAGEVEDTTEDCTEEGG